MKSQFSGLIFLTFLVLMSGVSSAGATDGPVPPEARQALSFAQRLYEEQDFYRAASEAKRFLFYYPEDSRAEDARKIIRKSNEALRQKTYFHEADASIPLPLSLRTKTPQAADQGFAVKLIRFYRDHLRTFKHSSCPSYPHCSKYTIEAVNKHGILLGTFIFVDRLFREVTTAGTPPFVRFRGKKLHYDPLEANDYWLNRLMENRP